MAKLRCWPGCLAFIAVPGPWEGVMVEVLHAAPATEFVLPDGTAHAGCGGAGRWVIKSLGRPFSAPVEMTRGGPVVRLEKRFGVCLDSQLRPILPPPAADTTPTDTAAPRELSEV